MPERPPATSLRRVNADSDATSATSGLAAANDDTAPTGNGAIRIVLAEDHAVVRSALRMLLDAEADFQVVAEAGDVDQAVRFVRGHQPDVLILDLNMPGGPSLRAIPSMLQASPDTAVVILTMQSDPVFAREAMQAGVLGYILKDAADSELVKAVRLAAEGNTYLQPELGARLAAEPAGPPDDLSEREVEILRLIALGHTNGEIAEELYLSVRTVESHRAHIQQKLRMSKRSELVRYALDRNLLGS
jgi:two-component system response regulator NreC